MRRDHKVVDRLRKERKRLVEFSRVGLHELDLKISVQRILHVEVDADDICYKRIQGDEDADMSDEIRLVESLQTRR